MAVIDEPPAHIWKAMAQNQSQQPMVPQWVRAALFAEDAKQYTAVRLITGDHHSQYQHLVLLPPGVDIEDAGAEFRLQFPHRCLDHDYDSDGEYECGLCQGLRDTADTLLAQQGLLTDEHGYYHTPFAHWLVKFKGGIIVPKAEQYAISCGG